MKSAKTKGLKSVKKPLIKRSRPYLQKRAWKAWSKHIRTEGGKKEFNVCYTCGKKSHYKDLDAGHFHHNKLDFDARNIHPQCAGCNRYRNGMLHIYETKLSQELGVEGMAKLILDANTKMYSKQELVDIIELYEYDSNTR